MQQGRKARRHHRMHHAQRPVLPRSCPGDVFANQLQLVLNKTF
jgi:hypothetical protein